jgi:hypothetical protein
MGISYECFDQLTIGALLVFFENCRVEFLNYRQSKILFVTRKGLKYSFSTLFFPFPQTYADMSFASVGITKKANGASTKKIMAITCKPKIINGPTNNHRKKNTASNGDLS